MKKHRIYALMGVIALSIIAVIILLPTFKRESSQARGCDTGKPASASLASSSEPALRKLSEYETVCKGAVTDTVMLFTAMPTTLEEADESARLLATKIKEFARHNIKPLVLFEPSTTIRTIINDIHRGAHDGALTTYFTTLKKLKLSEGQLGTWVLFPEANTPAWHNTDPAIFASNVTRVARISQGVFPDLKLSVLLNSTTYPSDDDDWSDGEQKDLRPYVASIPPGTLESFGYQGFPYVAPANASRQYGQFDGKALLPTQLASDAADALQTKNIWINTGTFARVYTGDPAEQVTRSPAQRQQTLNDVTGQADTLRNQGYAVSINLFAEDKSNKNEHTDWSYWPAGRPADSADTRVFQTFFTQLRERGIGTSLYDSF